MKPGPSQNERDPVTDGTALMGIWERLGALAIGLTSVAVGTIAVFKSGNQAGTAGLLVIAFAFLIIGVQGTPLIKFSSGDHSVEVARKARRLEHKAETALTADEANAYADAAAIVRGSAQPSAVDDARQFDYLVEEAPERLDLGKVDREPSLAGRRSDFLVQTDDRAVAVEAKYRSKGPLSQSEIRKLAMDAQASERPLLIVTNADLPARDRELNEELAKLPVPSLAVTWSSEDDDYQLRDAIDRLVNPAAAN